VTSVFQIVRRGKKGAHFLLLRADSRVQVSLIRRMEIASLALCLFLCAGTELLRAQARTGQEDAAQAAQLIQAGNLQGAEAEMRQAVELSPREPQYLVRLGLILGMQRRPQEAAESFESALKLDPDGPAARRNLAASQWQMGRLAAAQENLELVLKAEPGDNQALLLLAMVLIDARRYPAALAVAQKAAEAMPSSYRAYAVRGMAEMRMARYADSAESYARAAEINPGAAEANLGLAMSRWASGSVAESFATFEQGLKRFPGDAYHCLEYGRLLLKSARPGDSATETRAVALLERALTLNGSLSEPHYILGDLALRKGNTKEALAHLEQAVKLDAEASKVHFALFRAYRRLGRLEDAARHEEAFQRFQAIVRLSPARRVLHASFQYSGYVPEDVVGFPGDPLTASAAPAD
jgi:tetratricopeptide (TPR) repeat protein